MKVLLNVEYGYKTYLWDPQMSKNQLIDWWRSVDDFLPFWRDQNDLPGEIKELDLFEEPQYDCAAHVHENDDSHLFIDGKQIVHKGFEQ